MDNGVLFSDVSGVVQCHNGYCDVLMIKRQQVRVIGLSLLRDDGHVVYIHAPLCN